MTAHTHTAHWPPASRTEGPGRCGSLLDPALSGVTYLCTLRAGHDGMHHDSGCDWTNHGAAEHRIQLAASVLGHAPSLSPREEQVLAILQGRVTL